MAEIAVGKAISEGFLLIRRQPGAVLLWGVTQIVFTAAALAVMAPVYYAMFAAFRAGAGPAALQATSPQAMQARSISYLINLVQLLVSSVIWCAAFRAVLHPERSRFGFLRLGLAEVFVAVLLLGAYVAAGISLFVAVLVFGIVIALLVVMHLIWAAALVGVLAGVGFLVALVYLALRFSMVGPMIVEDGRFHLGDSWTLTRGHVGSLFMIGLLIFVVALVVQIVLLILFVAIGGGALAALAGGFQNIPALFQQPPQLLVSRLGLLFAVAALIWIPVFGCLFAIVAAPWARAYRDLQPPDLSATFA